MLQGKWRIPLGKLPMPQGKPRISQGKLPIPQGKLPDPSVLAPEDAGHVGIHPLELDWFCHQKILPVAASRVQAMLAVPLVVCEEQDRKSLRAGQEGSAEV